MAANERKILRCAIYTRKSSEHGLEQDFNSLDAQREAAEALSSNRLRSRPCIGGSPQSGSTFSSSMPVE